MSHNSDDALMSSTTDAESMKKWAASDSDSGDGSLEEVDDVHGSGVGERTSLLPFGSSSDTISGGGVDREDMSPWSQGGSDRSESRGNAYSWWRHNFKGKEQFVVVVLTLVSYFLLRSIYLQSTPPAISLPLHVNLKTENSLGTAVNTKGLDPSSLQEPEEIPLQPHRMPHLAVEQTPETLKAVVSPSPSPSPSLSSPIPSPSFSSPSLSSSPPPLSLKGDVTSLPLLKGLAFSEEPVQRGGAAAVGDLASPPSPTSSPVVVYNNGIAGSSLSSLSSEERRKRARSLNAERFKERLKKWHGSKSIPIVWYAPFFSGDGFGNEAIAFVLSLAKYEERFPIKIVQAPTGRLPSFEKTLPTDVYSRLLYLEHKRVRLPDSIVVCHMGPDFYFTKSSAHACPPARNRHRYVIGRAMYETDSIPTTWLPKLKNVDEVWVPTLWHAKVFVRCGVEPHKLVVVPESVNTDRYSPEKGRLQHVLLPHYRKNQFRFLSIFKWEPRKGWDILIRAFVNEFRAEDNVALYILTHGFSSWEIPDARTTVRRIVEGDRLNEIPGYRPPAVHFILEEISLEQMPALYASADSFVLPTRGEGWGRPIVEAMSMELPVIATFWSGPTEYMTEENSYPLPSTHLSPSSEPPQSGATKGHMWANPSLPELRRLMRHVSAPENKEEVRRKGAQARKDMVQKYCFDCLGSLIAQRFERIAESKLNPDLAADLKSVDSETDRLNLYDVDYDPGDVRAAENRRILNEERMKAREREEAARDYHKYPMRAMQIDTDEFERSLEADRHG